MLVFLFLPHFTLGKSLTSLQLTQIHSFYGWVIFHCLYLLHLFTHSSVDGPLGCFHVLAIVKSAVVNSEVHVSFRIVIFSGYMHRSGIAESYGRFIPSFLRNLPTVFIMAVSHQQCKRVCFLHFLQHLLFVDFFLMAILTGGGYT